MLNEVIFVLFMEGRAGDVYPDEKPTTNEPKETDKAAKTCVGECFVLIRLTFHLYLIQIIFFLEYDILLALALSSELANL